METNFNLLKNSKRLYKVFTTQDLEVYTYAFEDVFKEDSSELTYSLQEHLDSIMDLKMDEYTYNMLRDDIHMFVICRIK